MPFIQPSIVDSRTTGLMDHLRKSVLDPASLTPLTARIAKPAVDTAWTARERLAWKPIRAGDTWGGAWERAWIQATGTVPAAWAGKRVVVRVDCGGEVMWRRADGEPLLGLTNGSVFLNDYHKDLIHLLPAAQGGETVDLWLEAVGSGLLGISRTDPEFQHQFIHLHGQHEAKLVHLHLAVLDQEVYDLLLELEILHDLWKALPENQPRREKLMFALDRAVGAYHRAGAAAAREALKPAFSVPSDPSAIRFIAVGHAHIDTAWLWPLRETERKCARTFASAVRLLDDDPDYRFVCSQAVQYRWIEDHHPTIFDGIRRHVAEGRWEVVGGMWVEPDMNLTSGESIVRQLVHGQRYFESRFARRCDEIWIPDVFGYPASLPQIFRVNPGVIGSSPRS
jgi:alpha-mannosidase